MTIHDLDQRTPEWAALRLGRVTSTCADAVMATLKGKGEAAGRRHLRARLVLERLTGRSQEREFMTQAMQDGVDREADAYAAYEALTGTILRRVGFVSHDALMAGVSPDGVIGAFDALVEIKSPMAATHLEYLETGRVPTDYLRQVVHGQWITGAQWTDWLSFHPDFPAPLTVKLVRIHRDEAAIEEYDRAVRAFLIEVDEKLVALQALADRQAVSA